MKGLKLICLFCIFFLLIPSLFAQLNESRFADALESGDFSKLEAADWANLGSWHITDIFEAGQQAQIQWELVDQANVPIDYIDDIPPEYLDVRSIASGNLKLLAYEQIAYPGNIDKVGDIRNLNQETLADYIGDTYNGATLDIRKNSCEGGCTLKNGVLQNGPRGKSVTLSAYPPGTSFSLLSDKAGTIQANLRPGGKIDRIPPSDTITLIFQPKKGEPGVTLPQNVILNYGYVYYKNGQPYIKKGRVTLLTYSDKMLMVTSMFYDTNLYFGKQPKRPKANHIVWRDKDFILSGSGFEVEFPPKSRFFPQEKNFPKLIEENKVILRPRTGKITFNFAGERPSISIVGEAQIRNGKYKLDFRKDRLFSNVYNFDEGTEEGIGVEMDITYQRRRREEHMSIDNAGKLDYGNTKHFEMAWSGDVERDVPRILSELKDQINNKGSLKKNRYKAKPIWVWVETETRGGPDEWPFETSRAIAINTLAAENILVAPVNLGDFDVEKNNVLLNNVYAQKDISTLTFGHSNTVQNRETFMRELLEDWMLYKDRIPEKDRGLAHRLLELEALVPGVYALPPTELEASKLRRAIGKAYAQQLGKEALEELGMRHSKIGMLVGHDEKGEPITYEIPKDAPSIGCGHTQATIGRTMPYEESVIGTIEEIHKKLKNTNSVNYKILSRQLRQGFYKFPDKQSARRVEKYLNSHELGRITNWCIKAPGKGC